MKNFTTNAAKATIVAFFAIVVFLMGRCYGFREALPLLHAYDNYNTKCEILLDSIANWADYPFDITIGETDAYINYLDARESLDSLFYDN